MWPFFGNTDLWLANTNNSASQLRFYEAHTNFFGTFPGTAHYTSFEAPSLTNTIEYILPAAKPTVVGQVLEVSAISGDQITLTWGTDNTVAGRDGGDVPTGIAVPERDSRARESEQIKMKEEIEALRTELNALRELVGELQSEREAEVFNAK